MATKFIQGVYTPKNPQKYCGPNLNKIQYRSSWEHTVMRYFDDHPYVLKWSSESISIPYQHPFLRTKSGRPMIKPYIPDFFVVYADKTGKQHAEIWEIKPAKENPWISPNGKYAPKLQAIRMVNMAKWSAAVAYCAKHGIKFRIITENELFAFTRK